VSQERLNNYRDALADYRSANTNLQNMDARNYPGKTEFVSPDKLLDTFNTSTLPSATLRSGRTVEAASQRALTDTAVTVIEKRAKAEIMRNFASSNESPFVTAFNLNLDTKTTLGLYEYYFKTMPGTIVGKISYDDFILLYRRYLTTPLKEGVGFRDVLVAGKNKERFDRLRLAPNQKPTLQPKSEPVVQPASKSGSAKDAVDDYFANAPTRPPPLSSTQTVGGGLPTMVNEIKKTHLIGYQHAQLAKDGIPVGPLSRYDSLFDNLKSRFREYNFEDVLTMHSKDSYFVSYADYLRKAHADGITPISFDTFIVQGFVEKYGARARQLETALSGVPRGTDLHKTLKLEHYKAKRMHERLGDISEDVQKLNPQHDVTRARPPPLPPSKHVAKPVEPRTSQSVVEEPVGFKPDEANPVATPAARKKPTEPTFDPLESTLRGQGDYAPSPGTRKPEAKIQPGSQEPSSQIPADVKPTPTAKQPRDTVPLKPVQEPGIPTSQDIPVSQPRQQTPPKPQPQTTAPIDYHASARGETTKVTRPPSEMTGIHHRSAAHSQIKGEVEVPTPKPEHTVSPRQKRPSVEVEGIPATTRREPEVSRRARATGPEVEVPSSTRRTRPEPEVAGRARETAQGTAQADVIPIQRPRTSRDTDWYRVDLGLGSARYNHIRNLIGSKFVKGAAAASVIGALGILTSLYSNTVNDRRIEELYAFAKDDLGSKKDSLTENQIRKHFAGLAHDPRELDVGLIKENYASAKELVQKLYIEPVSFPIYVNVAYSIGTIGKEKTKFLYDKLGITYFLRYSKQMLERIYSTYTHPDPKKEFVIGFAGYDDGLGSVYTTDARGFGTFYKSGLAMEAFLKNHNLLIVEHSGGSDFKNKVRNLKTKFGSKIIGRTPAVVLMGHGSIKAVKAGYGVSAENYIYPEDLAILKSLFPADESNRRLFIDGCDTAASVRGFAHKAAKITQAYTTGATGDATKSIYNIDPNGDIKTAKLAFKGAEPRTFAPDGSVVNE
ncbi:MAG: hypothetical protein ABID61_05595, partial [Candidatus Micrarchaeota archaeon]